MRRFLLACLILLLVAPLIYAVAVGRQFSQTVAATQANTAVTFGYAAYVYVRNDGPNTVYVDFADTTSATDRHPLRINEERSLPWPVTGIGLICATAETASVRVLAIEVVQ